MPLRGHSIGFTSAGCMSAAETATCVYGYDRLAHLLDKSSQQAREKEAEGANRPTKRHAFCYVGLV